MTYPDIVGKNTDKDADQTNDRSLTPNSMKPPLKRRHYWDGEAMGQRSWLFTVLGNILTAVTIIIISAIISYSLIVFLMLPGLDTAFQHQGLTEEALETKLMKTLTSGKNLWVTACLFLSIAVWIPCLWLSAKIAQRWSLTAIISMEKRVRWRLFAKAFLVGILTWSIITVIDVMLGYMVEPGMITFQWPSLKWLMAFVFITPIVVFQSSAEELIFRGYLPQSLHHFLPGILKNRLLIATISSLLFAALHWNNPDIQAAPWMAMIEFFVLSMALCWLSLRLAGLEAAMALHAINNCMIFLVATPTSVTLNDQVLITLVTNETFGESLGDWLIQAVHLGATIAVFWTIGMWHQSPLSLARQVDDN